MSDHIPMRNWGRDHWTTLVYIETVLVDRDGRIDLRKMRVDRDLHPELVHHDSGRKCPTRLRNLPSRDFHDDYSCLEDAERERLIWISKHGQSWRVGLLELGWFVCGKLRRYRAEKFPEEEYFVRLTREIEEQFWEYT